MNNLTYVIIPKKDLTEDVILESQNHIKFIRYSLDDTKALLKFSSDFPIKARGYEKYTHKEILGILNGPDWYKELEFKEDPNWK